MKRERPEKWINSSGKTMYYNGRNWSVEVEGDSRGRGKVITLNPVQAPKKRNASIWLIFALCGVFAVGCVLCWLADKKLAEAKEYEPAKPVETVQEFDGTYMPYSGLIVSAGDIPFEAVEPAESDEPAEPVEVVEAVEAPAFSPEDLEALALVIYQEAGGDACSNDTRLKVGTVVMNRVASSRYPDTIEGVLLQKQQYGRLYWTGLVWPERADNPGEAHAVERAYECAERILNGERFLPEDVIYQAEFPQGTEVVSEQDGFYFCR